MNDLEQGYYACFFSNKDTIIPTVETLNSISHFEETLLSNLVNKEDHKSLNTSNVDFLAIKVFFGVANIKGIEKIAIGRISSLSDTEQTIFANALNKFSSKVWRKRKI